MPKATWDDSEFAGQSIWDDELEDYPIYDGPLPPKGVYRYLLKRLQLTTNKSNQPMLKGLAIVNEPAGSKKSQYNGADAWFNLNVTKQGAPWVNNFLAALVPEAKVAATRKAFWQQKVMLDKSEPPNVISIGAFKLPEGLLISAQTGHKEYNSDTQLDLKRFLRPSDTTPAETESPDDADAGDDEWGEEAEAETDVEETEDDFGDEEEEDPEFQARAAELEAMTLTALRKLAKDDLGGKVAELKPLDKDELIDWILEREFPPEGDEESAEEEPEEDFEEEEPEPEPEPEPAKPARRRPAAKPAAEKEEAPARPRTGTRRRKAGEPPF